MSLLHSASEELTLSSKGYKISRVLGEGSYAKVYLADFKSPDKLNVTKYQLACKIIDIKKAPKDFVKKFLPRELDILVKLNHPHIIHVHSIFQRKNKYYVFMRHAEQGDLLEYVSKKGPISEPQARVWFRQLSVAIEYLHSLNIVHRDLKCENALITNNFNLKLADFGFSRFTVDSIGKSILSDTYCGSLSYAAPEILKGQPYYPKATDLWSLGVILFVMLNKSMPFDDNNAKRLYEQQSNKRWKFRSKVVNILSDNAKRLVTNLLEPDITRRLKIEEVLKSNWISMDARLIGLSPEEMTAKKDAKMSSVGKISVRVDIKSPVDKSAIKVIKEPSKTGMRLSDDASKKEKKSYYPDIREQIKPPIKKSYAKVSDA